MKNSYEVQNIKTSAKDSPNLEQCY